MAGKLLTYKATVESKDASLPQRSEEDNEMIIAKPIVFPLLS